MSIPCNNFDRQCKQSFFGSVWTKCICWFSEFSSTAFHHVEQRLLNKYCATHDLNAVLFAKRPTQKITPHYATG